MILNNYWNYAGNINNYAVGISGSGEASANLGLVDMNNNTKVTCYRGNVNENIASYITATANILSNLKVCVGTGTTAPTLFNYCLENDVTANLSNFDTLVSVSGDSGQIRVVITITGLNPDNSAITLTEIGIYKTLWTEWSNDYYDPGTYAYNVLLLRHILEDPITLEPNSSFSFTFEWVQM